MTGLLPQLRPKPQTYARRMNLSEAASRRLGDLSRAALIVVALVVVFGYFFTVMPVYHNARLDEQAGRLEAEIASKRNELGSLRTSLVAARLELKRLKAEAGRQTHHNRILATSIALSKAKSAQAYFGLAIERLTEQVRGDGIWLNLLTDFEAVLAKNPQAVIPKISTSPYRMLVNALNDFAASKLDATAQDGVDKAALRTTTIAVIREHVERSKARLAKGSLDAAKLVMEFMIERDRKGQEYTRETGLAYTGEAFGFDQKVLDGHHKDRMRAIAFLKSLKAPN